MKMAEDQELDYANQNANRSVEFIEENGGGPNVRLRNDIRKRVVHDRRNASSSLGPKTQL